MNAVWSFWSKPFFAHHQHAWLSDRHHWLAWVLSLETAKRHYPTTTLVTDRLGFELLVKQLGLTFTVVSTELEQLRDADPHWWVLGKLWAYRIQKEPFVHLDNDVFLWSRLPDWMESADVLGQSPEWFPPNDQSWYRPGAFSEAIRAVGGWAPDEWWSSVSQHLDQAICCGIVGGRATDFLSSYADVAIRMIQHPRNSLAWSRLGNIIGDNILIEQYLLAACLWYRRQRAGSPFNVGYLFPSTEAAFDEYAAAAVGYTHLIGDAKKNVALMDRLALRVQRDFPGYYERCIGRSGLE